MGFIYWNWDNHDCLWSSNAHYWVRSVVENFSVTLQVYLMSGYFVGYFVGSATIPN